MLLAELREQVVRTGIEALNRGMIYGTAGNFSIRDDDTGLIAISPSGIPYPEIVANDVVVIDNEANLRDGARKPSSESPMHAMIYRAHPRIKAIVHTHSHYSTVVSTIRSYLPAILTEVCLVVGPRVPVTRYGLTGMDDIGQSVLEVMDDVTKAVILQNHGLIAFGGSFDEALTVATIVEEAARVYVDALAANGGREPDLVPEELVPSMRERFLAMYGQRE
ncbi:MAG: L-fuculose-phosphate aldolase [Thermomicrobiales bacterium]|nr:L-fuculose-phosphate aldolase [Thermomicrobiales bacterium]